MIQDGIKLKLTYDEVKEVVKIGKSISLDYDESGQYVTFVFKAFDILWAIDVYISQAGLVECPEMIAVAVAPRRVDSYQWYHGGESLGESSEFSPDEVKELINVNT
jgi:hypothetical protein